MAQLGERRVRIAEAEGSNPFESMQKVLRKPHIYAASLFYCQAKRLVKCEEEWYDKSAQLVFHKGFTAAADKFYRAPL